VIHLRRFLVLFAAAAVSCALPADDVDADDGVAPLVGEPEPIAAPDEGKADWLGSSPELWRRFWYYSYYDSLSAPLEAAASSPPYAGTRTVLLIPGTTIGPEFFVPMANRLRRDGFDPVIWAPPDLFTESLASGAARIADKVQRVLAARGASRLHIVAECDAGVATRHYLQLLGGDHHVDQVVTFVSAHHGSRTAPAGSWFTGWQALKDLQPDSAFLARLAAAPLPADLHLTSIYTCRDEYLWPYTTSIVAGATNVEFCGHPLGHFDGFWDRTVYQRILTTLRGQGATAPTRY